MIFLLTACDTNKTSEYMSKHTEEVMLNREIVAFNNDPSEDVNEDSLPVDGDKKVEDNTVLEVISKAEVDKTSANYYKHQGIIDCYTLDECIDLSYTIKQQFKGIIRNVFYLDVLDINGNSLGYFIDYTFNDYQFQDENACNDTRLLLQESIAGHMIDFMCDKDGLFRVAVAK